MLSMRTPSRSPRKFEKSQTGILALMATPAGNPRPPVNAGSSKRTIKRGQPARASAGRDHYGSGRRRFSVKSRGATSGIPSGGVHAVQVLKPALTSAGARRRQSWCCPFQRIERGSCENTTGAWEASSPCAGAIGTGSLGTSLGRIAAICQARRSNSSTTSSGAGSWVLNGRDCCGKKSSPPGKTNLSLESQGVAS